ncbi:MFS transporter [Actinoallomurus sp. NBC_01490]|uniref:MFS transporter n=1 Tax=Actinoallomurus sp. NBC_01490 TaxID=2903557 RepID=UPI002E2FB1A0|nr:MFS transporter [Actinoallomurus sp. NBC_01490]
MFSTFSGLPRTVWIIFAGTVVNRLGYMVTPFLVFYLGSRGVLTAQVPYVLGALGAGNIAGPMVGGFLADRLGRRPTMLIGLTGTAVAQGMLFAAPNVITLALAAVLLSGAGTMVSPAAGAALTDAVSAGQRRTAFTLFHWAVNIGTAVAGMLGGFLAVHGYWLLFAADAATSLAYALIVIALLPGGHRTDARPAGSGSRTGYAVVFGDPLMRALLPLFGIGLLIYSLTEVCLPLAIRDAGLSAGILGLMATLNAVLVVVLQPPATAVLARLPQVPVYVGSSTLVAVGVALTGVAHDTWSFAGTVVLWSIGEAMTGGIAAAIVASLAPEDARGRYQGSFQWAWGIGRFIALALGSSVYATAGPAVVWWFSAIAGITAALAVGTLAPMIARRSAPPEPAIAIEPAAATLG